MFYKLTQITWLCGGLCKCFSWECEDLVNLAVYAILLHVIHLIGSGSLFVNMFLLDPYNSQIKAGDTGGSVFEKKILISAEPLALHLKNVKVCGKFVNLQLIQVQKPVNCHCFFLTFL